MATYKVSATDGTADFANIAAITGTTSGDFVQFNRGETFTGTTLTAVAGVTYEAYGSGDLPILDGENTLTDVIVVNVANVTLKDLDVRNGVTRNIRGQSGSDNLTIEGVSVSGGTGTAMFLQGDGNNTLTNCTVTHSNAGASTYGVLLQPFSAVATTWTVTNLTLNGSGTNTVQYPLYIRQNTGATLTVNITDITMSNARTTSDSGPVATVRADSCTITNWTLDSNCVGKILVGASGETCVTTLDNLTFPASTDEGVQTTAGTNTLTIKNSKITDAQRSGVSCVATDLTILNTTIDGCGISGTGNGVIATTTSNLVVRDSNVSNTAGTGHGISCSGATSNIYNTTASGNAADGMNWTGTGTHYTEGCTANTNGSSLGGSGDGFSAHDTCTINQVGCVACDNSGGGFTHINNTTGYIRNCTAYGNYYKGAAYENNTDVAGFRWETDQNFEISHCISMDNDIAIRITDATIAELGTITLDNNNFYSSSGDTDPTYSQGGKQNSIEYSSTNTWAAYTAVDTNAVNTDPQFNDVTALDVGLKSTSPCLDAVAKWWTGGNPSSASGEPYPDFDIDRGGVQSTHGPFHPKNL